MGDLLVNSDPRLQYGEEYYRSGCGPVPYERSEHWLHFFGSVADQLIRAVKPQRVLDAGCAMGFLVESFWDRGVCCEGVDISEYAISNVRQDIRPYCRVGSLADPFNGSYDLITCIEVLEHVNEAEARLAVANLCSSAEVILFSSTPTDFAEPTHINVRPPLYWLNLFCEHSFVPDSYIDASFIAPHAFLLRRAEPSTKDYLKLFADQIRSKTNLQFQAGVIDSANETVSDVRKQLLAVEEAFENDRGRSDKMLSQARTDLSQALADKSILQARFEDLLETERTKARDLSNRMFSPGTKPADAPVQQIKSKGNIFDRGANWFRNKRDASYLRKSGLFDENWYLREYPDVAQANMDPVIHYLKSGASEHRNPSPNFHTGWYLDQNADVRASGINPLRHFAEYGRQEGRSAQPGTTTNSSPQQISTLRTARTVSDTDTAPSVAEALAVRFADTAALPVFYIPDSQPRLTVVTDSINSGSLYGGVGTALIMSAIAAQKTGAALRIVTRTETAVRQNFADMLAASGINWTGGVEFIHSPMDGSLPVSLAPADIVLTTSWWTTMGTRQTVPASQIVYLLQEDERMFYPFNDDRVRCEEILSSKEFPFLINSELLYNHLTAGPHPLPNIAEAGTWFEPAFPRLQYYFDTTPTASSNKKRFFFYARPNNERNLYWRGLEAISNAIEEGFLSPTEWDFYFVGRGVKKLRLPFGIEPELIENFRWSDYATFLRSVDLGLSLINTPHPSYPPLDIAASGGVAVTNQHGIKRSLEKYSRNILSCDVSVTGLTRGIANGVALANDREARIANYNNSSLLRDWDVALGPAVDVISHLLTRG